jgi:hypothetical protein
VALGLIVLLALPVDPYEKLPAPVGKTCLKQVPLPGALDDFAALASELFIGSQKTHIGRDLSGHLFYKYLSVCAVSVTIIMMLQRIETSKPQLSWSFSFGNIRLISRTQSGSLLPTLIVVSSLFSFYLFISIL